MTQFAASLTNQTEPLKPIQDRIQGGKTNVMQLDWGRAGTIIRVTNLPLKTRTANILLARSRKLVKKKHVLPSEVSGFLSQMDVTIEQVKDENGNIELRPISEDRREELMAQKRAERLKINIGDSEKIKNLEDKIADLMKVIELQGKTFNEKVDKLTIAGESKPKKAAKKKEETPKNS